ncbi:hypothetical protein PHJA_000112200 [Phtheirospermum japonicum]|uniref:RING-type E3 ubiquitin transferase n=1 Tax=Phtheirospermum japonicum TaxID=374723 RepID=A0A830AYU7_9LAMI|nr:hypothetical protein PHJA_000112200 [Phtheirospermum japonicum]
MPFSCSYNFLYVSVFTNIFISTSIFFPSLSTSISYNDHCASIIPESIPTVRSSDISIPPLITNHYTGGDQILGRLQKPSFHVTKSLKLQITPNYYRTNANAIYKVEANLYIRSPYRYYYTLGGESYHNRSSIREPSLGSITFSLNGFWSESSRKLCMVGSASWLNLDAVLKLKFADKNPTLSSSFVSGVLESTNSSFDPLSIFSFPALTEYSYSLVLKEFEKGFFGDIDFPRNESLNLEANRFCSMLTGRYFVFELEYGKKCEISRNCSPLGEVNKFLPSFMSLDLIQCSPDQRKVRYMLRFRNITRGVFNQDFDVDWMLIGEGLWDDKTNRLLIIACRILNAVEDCTIRLSLRYPSIWTIRDDAKIVGQIWTNRTVSDLMFFEKIMLKSSDENDMVDFPGLRYKYTEFDRVKQLCEFAEKKRNIYPHVHSHDMKFDMFIRNRKGRQFASGDATPLSIGNEFYSENVSISEGDREKKNAEPLSISYKIGIRPFRKVNFDDFFPTLDWSMNLRSRVEIMAEGVYDAENGHICMVGCRKLFSYNEKLLANLSTDCEILVNFEFGPLDARKWGVINGTIKSTRPKQDPLYFEDLNFSSAAFYRTVAKKVIRRMGFEITMFWVSSTLVCFFVGLQLFHVKRDPELLNCVSLIMVLILCLGHMILLALNFGALFLKTRNTKTALTLNSGLWFEANEVIVRWVTVVGFLLLIRLLKLVWTARRSEMTEKGLSDCETKVAIVLLLIYVLCEFFTKKLRSCYAGLILDGFLIPQIVYNAFRGSVVKALVHPFYIGISLVRLLPHAYDMYRRYSYVTHTVNGVYYFANPTTGFYSRSWDVIIVFGIVMLAVIIFMQQRYGGVCVLPRRFRELRVYENVPIVNNEIVNDA